MKIEITEGAKRGAKIGFIAGLLVAIGGAIKDAPYEGFSAQTFWRSPFIGMIEGAILGEKYQNLPDIILLFAVIGFERLTIELFKLNRALSNEYVPGKFIYGEWGVPKVS